MWGKARTLGLVTLVTVLIWIWADAETQRGGGDLLLPGAPGGGHPVAHDDAEVTVESLPVLIALPAGGGKLEWARVHPQTSVLERVTIAGPRAVIERVRRGDPALKLAALLTLEEADWGVSTLSKSVELAPAGMGLHFAGPAPTVRVTISR